MSSENNVLSLNINELVKEYSQLESELTEIDNLYNSSKNLLNESSKGSRGNYVFIANQTSNLISIKSHKMNLLKSMSDIKKTIIDLKIKEFNLNSKNDSVNDESKNIIEGLFRKMMNMDTRDLINVSIQEDINTEDKLDESDIDKLLDNRISSKNEDIKEDIKVEESKFKIVIEDQDNIPLIIDNDYNLIEEDESEEFKRLQLKAESLVILEIKEENGENIAIDSNGEVFEVVSL